MIATDLHISLKPEDGSELREPCVLFFRGSTYCDRLPLKDLGKGWRYVDGWSNGYRNIYISDTHFAILTECEGDLVLTIDADLATFERRIRYAAEYYGKE